MNSLNCARCIHRGPIGCHGDCTGADETHSVEVILIDGLYMMDADVAVIHKGKAKVSRYSTPTAPPDPWMQERREPWRKGR